MGWAGGGDGVAREVFAELVPSFLTQLLRRGDLWWLGSSEITDLRPRAPDFCHSKVFLLYRLVLRRIRATDMLRLLFLLREWSKRRKKRFDFRIDERYTSRIFSSSKSCELDISNIILYSFDCFNNSKNP